MRKILAGLMLLNSALFAVESLPVHVRDVVDGATLVVDGELGGMRVPIRIRLLGLNNSDRSRPAVDYLKTLFQSHRTVVLWQPSETFEMHDGIIDAWVVLGLPSVGFAVDDKVAKLPSVQRNMVSLGLANYTGVLKDLRPEIHMLLLTDAADRPIGVDARPSEPAKASTGSSAAPNE